MTTTQQAIDFSVDLTKALLWQYNESVNLQSIVDQKNEWYQNNQVTFWNDWITDVFDIRTCNQFGLVVWGIVLGIPLQIDMTPIVQEVWGFGTYNQNFSNGTFSIISNIPVVLTLEQQQILLLLRYNELTGKCSVPAINRMLARIFKNYGEIYVLDPLDMSAIIYVINFQPSSGLWFVLYNSGVLPRPATVGIEFIISGFLSWGFGTYNQNFNNGNFINPIIEG